MGSSLSDQAAKEKEAENAANLEQLMVMGQKQQSIYEEQLKAYYMNPEVFGKYEVVGGRMIAKTSFISASTSTGVNPAIEHGLDSIIDGLFGMSDTDDAKSGENSREQFKNGCTSLVKGAFDFILGESHASEVERTAFFIVPFGFTFYRIDTFMWRYNVNASAGVASVAKNMMVTVSAVGVLDTEKLADDELIGFVTQIVGDNKDDIIQWFSNYEEIKQKIKEMKNL